MGYVPYVDKDESINGCPRITEEEFQSLTEAGKAMTRARSEFARLNNNILNRYGKKQIEEIDENGLPTLISIIEGHNIRTFHPIY